MKKDIIIITFFLIGAVLGGVVVHIIDTNKNEIAIKDKQVVLDSSRVSIIELNKTYNYLFENLGRAAFGQQNNEPAIVAFQVLQRLTPELMELNKSLKLDCKRYREDGTPVMVKDKNGLESPLETLPEEIKIINE